jgi:hypothetical protein
MHKTGVIENEFGVFADEVLNAGWLPPFAELGVVKSGGMQGRVAQGDEVDVGAFMKVVYASQE